MTSVQVRQRGTLTLPVDVRERYNIQAGDTFRLLDLDGVLIFVPMAPMVPELAREIERTRIATGLTIGPETVIATGPTQNEPALLLS